MSKKELIEAVKTGDLEGFKKLLTEEPALKDMTVEEMKISLLMLTVYYRRQEFIDALVSMGAIVDIWEAAAMGDTERAAALLASDGSLVNEFAEDGMTPLGLAAFFGQVAVMKLLLERGAEVNQPSKNAMGVHPLNSAAATRSEEVSLEMMKILVAHGADVNAAQHGGITVLHEAGHHGNREKAAFLLEAGADRTLKTDAGKTAAEMAREAGFEEMAAMLE